MDHMSTYVAGVNPTITSINPASGIVGSSVVINGTNFQDPGATVAFGSTLATIRAISTTQITVAVPSISIGTYTVTVTNTDSLNASTSFTITAPPAPTPSGGYVRLPEQTQTVVQEEIITPVKEEPQVEVLGVELDYMATQLNKILEEAAITYQGDVNLILNNVGQKRNMAGELAGNNKYMFSLAKGFNLSLKQGYALTNFIVYGTETTDKLGAGERAGVINSYKAAFGKLPTTQSEWEDAIKIANGRWPGETSQVAEDNAKTEFKKVYLRDADMDNANDNAAVTIIAYGLRPDIRYLDNERAGIKSFEHVYGYKPISAIDWDIVRAIAYSGAAR
jgi:hypothetical protein